MRQPGVANRNNLKRRRGVCVHRACQEYSTERMPLLKKTFANGYAFAGTLPEVREERIEEIVKLAIADYYGATSK